MTGTTRSPGQGRRLAILPLIVLAWLVACAKQHEMAPRAAEPACRRAITLQEALGQPAADAGEPRIRWFAPQSPDGRHTLERWCATVGPAVVDSVPSPEFARLKTTDTLTVISWNAALGGGDMLQFLNQELGLSCADDGPQPGPDFSHFVLLVQEAHRLSEGVPVPGPDAPFPIRIDPRERPGPILEITEVADRCGLALVYVPLSRNGDRAQGERREDKGNAILASVSLTDLIAVELPLEASRKVAVGAMVTLPDGSRLRVVDVHLDVSAGLARILISGNAWRLEQAEALIDGLALAEASSGVAGEGRSVATLIAGDFNVWSGGNSALKRFERELPESPPRIEQPTRGAFPPDHLFFGAAVDGRVQMVPGSYRRIDELYYSDHHAVAVQVTTTR
jgi:endonuclease/exonuclease/phosphatase family metal-dependent hydrolase